VRGEERRKEGGKGEKRIRRGYRTYFEPPLKELRVGRGGEKAFFSRSGD